MEVFKMIKNKYYIKLGALIFVLVAGLFLAIATQNDTISVVFGQDQAIDIEAKRAALKSKPDTSKDVYGEEVRTLLINLKEGKTDLVINRAEDALRSDPNATAFMNILAEAYLSKGDLSAAEESAKKAIAIQPNDPWSCRLLATIYRTKGAKDVDMKNNNLALALEYVEKGLASYPDETGLLVEAAEIYIKRGTLNMARLMIDKALSINPNDGWLNEIKERIDRGGK